MRVLVVDDEASVVTGVERALTREGYEVATASDGRSGLDRVLSEEFDVIVLDVMLPGMNGYQICREARAHGVRTPILMLSAKDGEWDIADGLDLGADDYLTKPFSMVELLARVRARSRKGRSGEVYATGDLQLDPDLRRCTRGDEIVELTGREVSLLVALFDHVGDVVSKSDLLARAWGGGPTHPNAVEVYIGRLRRKLDEPFGTNDIETIRGVGYRLRDRSAPA